MAILHTPDGIELRADAHQIAILRPNIHEHTQRQLAPGTGSIVYVGGQKIGVQETIEQVQNAMRNCIDGEK